MCRNNREFLIFCEELFKLVSPDNPDPTIFMSYDACVELVDMKHRFCEVSVCSYCCLHSGIISDTKNTPCNIFYNMSYSYFNLNGLTHVGVSQSELFNFSIGFG